MSTFLDLSEMSTHCNMLQSALKENINFKGCEISVRIILKEIGFKWKWILSKKLGNTHKLHTAKPDLTAPLLSSHLSERPLFYGTDFIFQKINESYPCIKRSHCR